MRRERTMEEKARLLRLLESVSRRAVEWGVVKGVRIHYHDASTSDNPMLQSLADKFDWDDVRLEL